MFGAEKDAVAVLQLLASGDAGGAGGKADRNISRAEASFGNRDDILDGDGIGPVKADRLIGLVALRLNDAGEKLGIDAGVLERSVLIAGDERDANGFFFLDGFACVADDFWAAD